MSSFSSVVAEIYPGEGGVHHGFLRVSGAGLQERRTSSEGESVPIREFWFQVKDPRPPRGGSQKRNWRGMQGAELVLEPELAKLVGTSQASLLSRRLCESRSLDSFKIELEDNVSRSLRQRERGKGLGEEFDMSLVLAPPQRITALVEEINSLPDVEGRPHIQRLVSVDGAGFSRIELRTVDSAGREHRFQTIIPAAYPRKAPVVSAELPSGGVGKLSHSRTRQGHLCSRVLINLSLSPFLPHSIPPGTPQGMATATAPTSQSNGDQDSA